MKKFAAIIFAAIMTAVPVMADGDVTVNVNGIEAPEKGVILDSRTMVPVRGVTEALGFTVEWDAETKTATFTKDVVVIKMTAGEKSFYVNNIPITPDVPQSIINDRFMLPLRAMCESVGAEVNWDGETKTAFISTSAIEVPDSINIPDTIKEKTEEADDTGVKLETSIPGISIEVVSPDEVPDTVNEIDLG